MSLSSLKKWFSSNKNKSKKSDPEKTKDEDKNSAKPSDLHTSREIVKLECEINKVLVSSQSRDCGFELVKKIRFFENYLTENKLLLDSVKLSFSEKQQQDYWKIVDELRHCCRELGSMLKNKDFFYKLNENVAEVFGQRHPAFKHFKEKREQVCVDVESILNKRMMHKWSILKASKNKPLIEKFLNEITGQKKILALREKQMSLLLKKCTKSVGDTVSGKCTPIATGPVYTVISDDRLVEEGRTSDSPLQDHSGGCISKSTLTAQHGFVDESKQGRDTDSLAEDNRIVYAQENIMANE